jgi:hypothetical protein
MTVRCDRSVRRRSGGADNRGSRDGKTVLRGLWTTSAYVSCLNHSGLASQIQIASTLPGTLPEPIATIGLLASNPPSLKRLLCEVVDEDAD